MVIILPPQRHEQLIHLVEEHLHLRVMTVRIYRLAQEGRGN
jgi:hypothetical protein